MLQLLVALVKLDMDVIPVLQVAAHRQSSCRRTWAAHRRCAKMSPSSRSHMCCNASNCHSFPCFMCLAAVYCAARRACSGDYGHSGRRSSTPSERIESEEEEKRQKKRRRKTGWGRIKACGPPAFFCRCMREYRLSFDHRNSCTKLHSPLPLLHTHLRPASLNDGLQLIESLKLSALIYSQGSYALSSQNQGVQRRLESALVSSW